MKTIFWNVDTQRDFMNKDGALPVPNAGRIEENLRLLTQLAARRRIKVVNTADWHTRESEEISDNPDYKTTFPAHCIIGTQGAEFIPETNPDTGSRYGVSWMDTNPNLYEVKNTRNVVLYKDKFDVFTGNPYTESVLKAIHPNRAVVYGVATNVCVDFAVIGLRQRGVEVYVPLDAIKELPQRPLEETLDKWRIAGARLVTCQDVLEGKL
jgi:nicotinamidase/pyrazinamidase